MHSSVTAGALTASVVKGNGLAVLQVPGAVHQAVNAAHSTHSNAHLASNAAGRLLGSTSSKTAPPHAGGGGPGHSKSTKIKGKG